MIEVVNGVQLPLLGKWFNFNVLFCVNVTANDVCTGNSKDPHVISGAFSEVCTFEGEKVLILKCGVRSCHVTLKNFHPEGS